jgi:hypothetical protein
MSALKAVKITKNNKQELEAQYSMSEDFLEYSSGLYLVAGFGDTQHLGILTRTGLHGLYDVTGNELANGFFEVIKKETV